MPKKLLSKTIKKLRTQYQDVPREERLAWCTKEARQRGMSYGRFVNMLGI